MAIDGAPSAPLPESEACAELEADVESEAVASLATLLTVHYMRIPTSQHSLYSTNTPQVVLPAR